jgi:hypothetical protein
MANSAHKIAQFCKEQGVNKGVIYHSAMNKYLLIATGYNLRGVINIGALNIAQQAINNAGQPVHTHVKNKDVREQAALILAANGIEYEIGNTAPRNGKKGNAIMVNSVNPILTY